LREILSGATSKILSTKSVSANTNYLFVENSFRLAIVSAPVGLEPFAPTFPARGIPGWPTRKMPARVGREKHWAKPPTSKDFLAGV
jgi:hypothetical protein